VNIGIATDSAGNVYIADGQLNHVCKLTPGGVMTAVAGSGSPSFSGDGGSSVAASLNAPAAVAIDASGNMFIGDSFNLRVRKVVAGIISTFVGIGTSRPIGDGGPAKSASVNVPEGNPAIDPAGNLFFSDTGNNRVRKVTPAGVITTVAGNGAFGFSGDGGPAASASFRSPLDVALDSNGNLYILDQFNNRVRKVSQSGTITTFAGSGDLGFAGDGGPATSASFSHPQGIAFDKAGNLFISDNGNHRIRKVTPAGIITTVAGNGTAAFSGDGGPATNASLNSPVGLAFDASGNLYIGERSNNRVRKVNLAGTISTVAGNGTFGSSGDGGQATNSSIEVEYLAVDNAGNLLIAQNIASGAPDSRIRSVTPTGIISTVVGAGPRGFSGDGGLASAAALAGPEGLAVDANGNLFIVDAGNGRIRKVLATPLSYTVSPATVSFTAASRGAAPAPQTVRVTSAFAGLACGFQSTAAWLFLTPPNGAAPLDLQVNVDPSQLVSGNVTGTVVVSCAGATPPSQTVTVNVSTTPSTPGKLGVGRSSLSFSATKGGGPLTDQLSVLNRGGGTMQFAASASTTTGGGWLQVSQASGTATPGAPASLTVTATTGSLSAGTYSGAILIGNPDTGDSISVPVTLAITAAQTKILLSQVGLTFLTVAQGGTPLPQTVGILNAGSGSMSWTAQATTLSGSGWLSLSATSGTVASPLLDVSFVDVQVNAQSLAPGDYFGSIQVSAPGAANSPQAITVVLNVLPAGSNPGPEVRPTGLVFTGLLGSNPGSQSVNLSNLAGAKQLSYGSSPTYVNGTNWLSYLPANATIDTAIPTRIVVQPDFTQLAPGIYRGAITIALTDGSIRTVGILSVVAPSGGNASEGLRALARGCSPNRLQMQPTSSQQSLTASVGQPLSIEMLVVDDCGTPLTPQSGGAAVQASFSNGDPALTMVHTAGGKWSGTWQPRNGTPGSTVRVTITAFQALAGGKVLGEQIDLTAGLTSGAKGPLPLSVLNGASFLDTASLAPGVLISIFGSGLASSSTSGTTPLPTDLAGTQVTLGGQALPLLYASDGQVNAQVPYDLSVNTELQLQVKRGTSLSVPQSLTVAPAQPAIFTLDQAGHGQGAILNVNNAVVDAGAPAAPGDTVVIYCTGLGAVTPAVSAGVPTPTTSLSVTVSPVTVTIGGQPATVQFAGLSPGYAGLYQINAVVPAGVTPGNAVAVVLQTAGQISPPVTMAVRL
jgi:uncharacterized protein (TIGR03437 family)